MSIVELTPTSLWQHFATICAHPHPSGEELNLRDHIMQWAHQQGLSNQLDSGGNLIIRKPASKGMEDRQGIILQAHLDMVCQKNQDKEHDFSCDPIIPIIDQGWVKANGTTLGADNGIGLAAALAVLEDKTIVHGPLEVLLTLNEEAGMSGAHSLQADLLQGQLLFNLDTEAWGDLYIGCAGGMDIHIRRNIARDTPSPAYVMREISITGLKGGHSGCDIHRERPNAIRLLARLLKDARLQTDARLINMSGGSARNALPREAFAVVAIPACDEQAIDNLVAQAQIQFRADFAGIDDGICVNINDHGAGTMLRASDTQVIIDLLLALPHGVRRRSHILNDVVDVSNNLGIVNLNDILEITLMVRALSDSGLFEVVHSIEACARLAEAVSERKGAYSGWKPNTHSRALTLAQSVYREQFGENPDIKVIHAGLECGVIANKYPHIDMVSFGPTIQNAHSPDEKVEIASVAKFWGFLKNCLAAVPKA